MCHRTSGGAMRRKPRETLTRFPINSPEAYIKVAQHDAKTINMTGYYFSVE